MTTYNTGNSIGSTSPKDLYDNAENLDVLLLDQEKLSHPDRLGVPRWTWHGMEERFAEFLASSGFQFLADYAPTAGIEVTEYNQVLRDSTGNLWRLDPSVPIPYTTDGSGMPEGGAFLSAGDASALAELDQFKSDLADPLQGGGLVGVTTETGNQTLSEALGSRVIYQEVTLTVNIPTDYPTLQEAIDDLSNIKMKQGEIIELMVESGHMLTSGVSTGPGSYDHFQISSVDPVVPLDPSFPATDIVYGNGLSAPTLNCLIDANGQGLDGYHMEAGCVGKVNPGCGIDNCQQQACHAREGSHITANGGLFRNSSQSATSYSGILAWGATIYANSADVSGSNYYGAQAAASGTLHFRDGVADGAARHGVRATNCALVNARGASSRNTGVSGFRAFDTGTIHATDSDASGSVGNAYLAENNSVITADNVTADAQGNVFVASDNSRIMSENLVSTSGGVSLFNGSKLVLINPSMSGTSRMLSAADGSEIVVLNGSVSGGDGTRMVNCAYGSTVSCRNVALTASNGDDYLAVVDRGSTFNHIDGSSSYPNDAVNLLNGSFLRVNGSGVLESDVPGMSNNTLSERGIMWGAS